MSDDDLGTFSFLPWVREGASTSITVADTFGINHPARVTLPITLKVNSVDVNVPLKLNGPSDVTGIDPRQIVRMEPRPWTADFEPNYFPAIEFDRPDFPWLFSPLAPDIQDRLRPWLCLVVVKQQPGVSFRSTTSLPVLEIKSPAVPAQELPNLAESWAWAHAQVIGKLPDDPSLAILQEQHPERTLSRLLCPRKLTPKTRYHACVVPTFDVGRRAGLGEEIKPEQETSLEPAWKSDANTVLLPVYHHWEFFTSAGGDFESLVRLLQPREVDGHVGYRDMYVGDAGFGLPKLDPDQDGAILSMEGALRAPQNEPKPWPDPPRGLFETKLRPILDAPETQLENSGGDPIVAPPIYARWHAAQKVVPPDNAMPHWLRELNLDPRHRAAAGLGTLVVQDQQEDLMASAWDQIGDVMRANRALREAQLARAVGIALLDKHLAPMSEAQLITAVSPAHARLMASPITLWQKTRESVLPSSTVTPIFRRLVRPRSPVRRRFPTFLRGRTPKPLLERLNDKSLIALLPCSLSEGAVTLEQVSWLRWGRKPPFDVVPKSGVLTADLIKSAPGFPNFALPVSNVQQQGETPPLQREHGDDNEIAANFRNAMIAHLTATEILRDMPDVEKGPPLDLPQVQVTLLGQLDPRITIPARVNARINPEGSTFGWAPEDPIEPIMAHPVFPQPMYEPLRDLSPAYLVPGVDLIPPNTVTLLETNPRFIEAYMTGLNHEMSRELLWREYPTDQRGSYFRQFWDVEGRVEPPKTPEEINAAKDIEPIHTWKKAFSIGENLAGPGALSSLVLVIRGELLRRYPNTIIYAAKAVEGDSPGTLVPGDEELYPLFRGTLPPDITFIGFELSEEDAVGIEPTEEDAVADPGWFFVLQEQPSEPRFGLDVASFPETKPKAWNELSWGDLVADAGALDALTYAPVTGPKPDTSGIPAGEEQWGHNSAAMAYITLQQPMRVAMHATRLLSST